MISLLLLPPIQALVLLLLWRRPRLQFYASLAGAALFSTRAAAAAAPLRA